MSISEQSMAIFFDPQCLDYVLPGGVFEMPMSPLLKIPMAHPEGPERIANIRAILQRGPLAARFNWHCAAAATEAELRNFHSEGYLADLAKQEVDGGRLCSSTCLPAGGLHYGKRAVGQALSAMRQVYRGEERQAYALVRPASHHAAPSRADGYCYYNATALAALEGLAQGAERVVVIDWDTHHGNGTQTGFYARRDVLTISMHMDHGAWGDSHPETGTVAENGIGEGRGYNLNFPLPFGAGDHCAVAVMRELIVPVLAAYSPDVSVVANGQDANAFDPNGRQRLSMQGFFQMASALRQVADAHCEGRMVMVQEGGYNPAYAPFCAYGTVAGCLGASGVGIEDPLAYYPDNPENTEAVINDLRLAHRGHGSFGF